MINVLFEGILWCQLGQCCEPPRSSGHPAPPFSQASLWRPQDRDDLRRDSTSWPDGQESLLILLLVKASQMSMMSKSSLSLRRPSRLFRRPKKSIHRFLIILTIEKRRAVFTVVLVVPTATPHWRRTAGKASHVLTPSHHSAHWIYGLHLQNIHFWGVDIWFVTKKST